ncbi:MAG: exopolyphosphatase [Eubacterium sp.]|nr:exopolyphosphatase [Eubacterium sp.]
MAFLTFGAIHIGSYEVTLEIFEISRKDGIHCIDKVSHRIELGHDSFSTGRIGFEMVDELCDILSDFRKIMDTYKVDGYSAIATSAVREAENDLFILGKIRQTTGIDVRILSNSEQRFLSYKAIASIADTFEEMICDGTAVVDLDGGSIQISIFDKSELIMTQNMKIGNLRVREKLQNATGRTDNYEALVEQYIHHDFELFQKLYIKERRIRNVVLNGDFITEMIFQDPKHRDRSTRILNRDKFEKWYKRIGGKSVADLAIENNIAVEYASLLRPTAVIYHKIVSDLNPENIWTPGTHLQRGLAYEFAEAHDVLRARHDFENDIVTCARNIATRYAVSLPHIQNMDMTAMSLFDATLPMTGMTSRDRLLLRVAVMLHDVGKFIGFNQIGESSRNIIMSNEIIGLSHAEREIIALCARYVQEDFPQHEDIVMETSLDTERYLKVASFVAIIRMANGLDRSHRQKIQSVSCELKKQKLVIRIEVRESYALEEGLLQPELDFFNEVFGVRPVVRLKRIV